eukprot:TRINITY_DN33191_c0_g1_i1.p1 TRINITY_DN33191_c0_g1~~TRINITY_DN33191_c0_g1_i1.p1  ORF type:complete len:103 (-),score=8.76 TRINITY_DN33191_c0_g1_i1:113-421(-)
MICIMKENPLIHPRARHASEAVWRLHIGPTPLHSVTEFHRNNDASWALSKAASGALLRGDKRVPPGDHFPHCDVNADLRGDFRGDRRGEGERGDHQPLPTLG